MLRYLMYLVALWWISGTCLAAGLPLPAATDAYEHLVIQGEEVHQGLFDPSMEYGPDGTGWLVYSRVTSPKYVETRLARSLDKGKSWQFVATLNPSFNYSLSLPNGKQLKGVWRFEVPALVYDAGDVPARRWKLISQQYFTVPPYKPKDRRFDIGWISLREAASPGGPWSKPLCLFGDKPECRVNPNSLHADLHDVKTYHEPGIMVYRGTLYVSLDASTTLSGLGEWNRRRIILLASDDHGQHWRYVNTLTDGEDASRLGYHALTGSSLLALDDRAYAFIVPSGRKGLFVHNRAHDGTLLIAFRDITRGELERDSENALVIRQRLPVTRDSGGLADYDVHNTGGGVIFAQVDLSVKRPDAEFFQLFNTHIQIKPGEAMKK